MATFDWTFWIKATTEDKATKVFARVLARAERTAQNVEIEPYPKIGGFVIRFRIEFESATRNDQIVEAIYIGQSMATQWMLFGNITDDPSAWSSHCHEPGVIAIEWKLQ